MLFMVHYYGRVAWIILYIPNIVAEWLTLLLYIWEVLGSNLGPQTSCPE
jgi:hypothetical protein